ncbi:hypothetical protein ES703_05546 [subsurface metagenome]
MGLFLIYRPLEDLIAAISWSGLPGQYKAAGIKNPVAGASLTVAQ